MPPSLHNFLDGWTSLSVFIENKCRWMKYSSLRGDSLSLSRAPVKAGVFVGLFVQRWSLASLLLRRPYTASPAL